MENNLDGINNIHDSIFEQINTALRDLKDKPEEHRSLVSLIDQLIQLNKLLHDRLNEFSAILSTHGSHLGSHDQHLEAHDSNLAALTQRIELLKRY